MVPRLKPGIALVASAGSYGPNAISRVEQLNHCLDVLHGFGQGENGRSPLESLWRLRHNTA
jgi:hypothetical protein